MSSASLPLISIVTPSYNQGVYIEATIQSVIQQKYPRLEYIVIDGGSTDQTCDILRQYEPHLTYWISEPDDGQAHAINKGFARSTGDIMGWLNSDDILFPDALWKIAHHFQQQPDTALITGLRRVINADSAVIRNELMWLPEREIIKRAAFIAQETTYWHRRLWDDIGSLDASFQFAMDYEYWQRALAAGYTFDFIAAYLGGFRQHDAAKSSSATATRSAELARIYQRYDIAMDEDHALAQLDSIAGASWRHKKRMLREFGEKSLSDDPTRYVQFFHLLHAPIIGESLVNLHRLYNTMRNRPVY